MKSLKWATIIFLFLMILVQNGSIAGTTDIESRVDAIFAKWDRTDSPGCALGVYRDGQLIYSRGFGMANLELGTRNTPQNVFDLGSTSKQFTAFSILLLAKDGKLSLDDDIRKFLPEIPNYGNTITIRHLIHHTSGIRDYCSLLSLSGFRNEDITTDHDALEIISRQKALNFKPGSEFLYSNSGYFLLSIIVKRVSGLSLRDFAQKRIFGPLGMNHTQYNDTHTRIIPNRATGYSEKPGGFGISMSNWEQTGDGAVLTSVEDLLLWDRNFYDAKVGGADVIAQMQTPGKLNDGTSLDYAAGLFIEEYRGLKTISHAGGWAGYRAELLRFPGQKFSVVCLCNQRSTNPTNLAQKVAEVYLGEFMKPKPGKQKEQAEQAEPSAGSKPSMTLPVSELETKVGSYYNVKYDSTWKLTVEEGKLIANGPGRRFELSPTAPDVFSIKGESITINFVNFPTNKRPRMNVMVANEEEPRIFDPVDTWKPTQAQLAEMAGNYRSDEIGTVLTLISKEGTLLLKSRLFGDDPVPLTPGLKDSFILKNITISFSGNPKGKINGFNLDTGRMKHIRFTKLSGIL